MKVVLPSKHLPVQSQQQKQQKKCEICPKLIIKTPELLDMVEIIVKIFNGLKPSMKTTQRPIKTELFSKIMSSFKPLIFFANSSIL